MLLVGGRAKTSKEPEQMSSFNASALAAVKAAVLITPRSQIVDMIQLNQPPAAQGVVTIGGDGSITVGGVAFTNSQYQLLGAALGVV
jgi:hypothetical protein